MIGWTAALIQFGAVIVMVAVALINRATERRIDAYRARAVRAAIGMNRVQDYNADTIKLIESMTSGVEVVHDVRYPSDLESIPAPLTGRERRAREMVPLLEALQAAHDISDHRDGVAEAIEIVERFIGGSGEPAALEAWRLRCEEEEEL